MPARTQGRNGLPPVPQARQVHAAACLSFGVTFIKVAKHELPLARRHADRNEPTGQPRRRWKVVGAERTHGRSNTGDSPRLKARSADNASRNADLPAACTL